MEYRVLPFKAKSKKDSFTPEEAANQLQNLIDSQRNEGFEFQGMESIYTVVSGSNGCFGIGKSEGFTGYVHVAVFRK